MNQQKLRELENRCIQEHAPTCKAACPVHVDVRGMITAIQQGDFSAGLKIFQKSVPFPGIISHICDQPCTAVCKRGEAGDAIAISALEKACVTWGIPGETARPLPIKPMRVAVVGGGLSGMTVAFDLRRKGYPVKLYEANGQLGGSLWEIPQEILPWPVISQDVKVLEELRVEITLSTSVGQVGSNGRLPPLTVLREHYDAIYLGTGVDPKDMVDLSLDSDGQVEIDPVTYMTSQNGIFAGGSFLHRRKLGSNISLTQPNPVTDQYVHNIAEPAQESSVSGQAPTWRSAILSVMDGRRAATSIDRYLQQVSLTAARSNEGPYTTRLFTSMKGLSPLPAVIAANPKHGYTSEEATAEANRCIQCECMECVKACEFLKQYGGYPKKYVREIYNNLSIVMGTRYSNKLINSCSLCGLCGEICPEDLDMGSVCKESRQIMVEQKRMPPSAHDFALRDMAFSNSDKFTLARNQPDTASSLYAFFPGCQLSASAPEYVENVYDYLLQHIPSAEKKGIGLILGCCGAPADWAGRSDLFKNTQIEFMAEYEQLGRPKLILACSSCYQVFKTHSPEVEIVSLWEVMDQYGLPNRQAVKPVMSHLNFAIHDPCSTRYETGIQDAARNLLGKLGCQVQELPLKRERTECCSYGGLMWLANPELAVKATQRRISESQLDYVTYCAMCRDFFSHQGKPTLHLLDLIYGADPQTLARRVGPGYSQRHENRAHLKRSMLKRIWREDMESSRPYEQIRLIITPKVQQQIEERLILVEDIQQVIEYAERTGKKLRNKRTNNYLAHYKPTSVTYWVEYVPEGDSFVVIKAYSHRMEMEEVTNT